MTVTVIYGSDSGMTKKVAEKIAARMQGRALDVRLAQPADFETSELLILGSPTYGMGNLQPDWESRLSTLQGADLTGKKVALFGLGDQMAYPDTFVDAMGLLYDEVVKKGASVIGFTETGGYDFSESLATRDGKFVGLALDEENQSSKTDDRVAEWTSRLKS